MLHITYTVETSSVCPKWYFQNSKTFTVWPTQAGLIAGELVGMHWGRRWKKQSKRECHQWATKFLTIHQFDISDCPKDQPLRRSDLIHAFHGARHTYLEHMKLLRNICFLKEYMTTSGDEMAHKSILPSRKHSHQNVYELWYAILHVCPLPE